MSESFPRPAEAGHPFTLGELGAALGARLEGDPAAPIASYALDSRATGPGALFFALKGERADGHAFLAEVKARGATAAVVHSEAPAPEGLAVLRCDDVTSALARLGTLFRDHWPLRVVGITGSAGKTTTKEFAAALLATRFRVFKSEGNLNSTLGLPLTLSRRRPEQELAVLELGMSTPGELRRVAAIARPDIAVVTNVGFAHIMNFSSADAIAAEKATLLESVPPSGVFVANADDGRVMAMRERFPGRTLSFGLSEGADLRGHDLEPRGERGTSFCWSWRGHSASALLAIPGAHHVRNALAALAVAAATDLDPLALAGAVEALGAGEHRGGLRRLAGDVTLLDDCYNSNPAALRSALETLTTLPGTRRVAIVGDMRELGAWSEPQHRDSGRRAAEAAQLIIAVGPESRALIEEARAAGAKDLHWFPDAATAASAVVDLVRDGDAVLVKASRGIGLEAVVEALLQERP